MFQKIFERKKEKKAMSIYGDYYGKKATDLCEILSFYKKNEGYRIAIWGGGYKGAAFLKCVDSDLELIEYVYDINEKKHNTFMSTGHLIVNYKDMEYQNVDVVCIMNNNFETEIAGMLLEAKMHVILVNVDSIICGNLTVEEALSMYHGRV